MSSTELQFQKRLIDAVEERGGWAIKLSNRFTIGIPDLLVQIWGWPTMLLEVKLVELPVNDYTKMQVLSPLTALQKQTIIKAQNAGALAGVIWVQHERNAGECMMTSIVLDPPYKGYFREYSIKRHRGQSLALMLPGVFNPLLYREERKEEATPAT